MAEYIAKPSYRKLSDEENYCAYGSASSHLILMDGLGIDGKNVPKKLLEHLTKIEGNKKPSKVKEAK